MSELTLVFGILLVPQDGMLIRQRLTPPPPPKAIHQRHPFIQLGEERQRGVKFLV